ncbi:hypothetical protein K3495_g9818 [Podosphaera aphanis]|nr:hypothetical protein K3495_g9818 [Podosphaera aphanis]
MTAGLKQHTTKPILTEIDNASTIAIANSDKINARNRHFLMRQATVREAIKAGLLTLECTPTDLCKADRLTKVLQRLKHVNFCEQMKLDLKRSLSGGGVVTYITSNIIT